MHMYIFFFATIIVACNIFSHPLVLNVTMCWTGFPAGHTGKPSKPNYPQSIRRQCKIRCVLIDLLHTSLAVLLFPFHIPGCGVCSRVCVQVRHRCGGGTWGSVTAIFKGVSTTHEK